MSSDSLRSTQFEAQPMQFCQPSQAPKIWTRRHRNQTFWFAYDPRTRQERVFLEEAQLKAWLAQDLPAPQAVAPLQAKQSGT